MQLKVYVAGSSRERVRCKALMDAVREAGHEITHDWVAVMERVGSADAGLDTETLREHLQDDLRGAAYADLVVLAVPHEAAPSSGCWFELGYALREGKALVALQRPLGRDPGWARCFVGAVIHVPDASPDCVNEAHPAEIEALKAALGAP